MKIAIAHDWLNQMGGAENVLEVLVSMFPEAPIFTTIYAPNLMPPAYRNWNIQSSWLNYAPAIHRHHQPYLPLYPAAVRSLNFNDYDLIISNKSGFIHGIKTRPHQKHLCYCLAPTRYVWDYEAYAARERIGGLLGRLMAPLLSGLRRWDYQAAQQVDSFCAISTEIQQRIQTYYHRNSLIIHPPVDTEAFQPTPSPSEDYYLIVSRLIPYKRIDLAIQACTQLKKRLIIVGTGRDQASLEAMAGPTIEFTGYLPRDDVIRLMANCKAFIFPGYEDFGLTPVEAQAAGRPVIAFARGGALDTIKDRETGLFFQEPSVECLIAAIETLESLSLDPQHIRNNAEFFGIERFKQAMLAWISQI